MTFFPVALDVSGVFLVFLSLTGLGLLFYLKKVRIKGLVVMTALVFGFDWVSVHIADFIFK